MDTTLLRHLFLTLSLESPLLKRPAISTPKLCQADSSPRSVQELASMTSRQHPCSPPYKQSSSRLGGSRIAGADSDGLNSAGINSARVYLSALTSHRDRVESVNGNRDGGLELASLALDLARAALNLVDEAESNGLLMSALPLPFEPDEFLTSTTSSTLRRTAATGGPTTGKRVRKPALPMMMLSRS
jgi:hypothetical protein